MKRTDFFWGFVIGIATALAGTFLFLEFFTSLSIKNITTIKQFGLLGQVITIGSLLNLVVFFIMISRKKDMIAKGIILATITLAILTLLL
jgi:hypothetical protein